MGRSFSLKSHLNPCQDHVRPCKTNDHVKTNVRPCQDSWCMQMELNEVARTVQYTTHFSEFPFCSFNLLKVSQSLGTSYFRLKWEACAWQGQPALR